jgi:TAT (twin-arginine translocation) pathway signal sequence
MDRRDFLLTGSAAAAAATGVAAWRPPVAPTLAATVVESPRMALAKAAPPVTAKAAAMGQAQLFQTAYLEHPFQRGSLARQDFDAPMRLIFNGFGALSVNSELQSLLFEAAYMAPDTAILRHQLWGFSKRGGRSNPAQFTLSRANFVGFIASYETLGPQGKKQSQDHYHLGAGLPVEYGSYVFAGRSASTGELPDWSRVVYSGEPGRPVATLGGMLIDFDYLSFTITRLAA